MRTRRYHPLQDPKTLAPLTLEEYEDFRSRLKHARIATALLVAFSVAAAVTLHVLKLNVPVGVYGGLTFGLVIYGMYRLYALKCPRCGTVPMTSRVSLISGQVEAGNFVALNPKRCMKCDAELSSKPAS